MKDPEESLTPEGKIITGVRQDRIPLLFKPAIDDAIKEVESASSQLGLNTVSLYLYGSVATGAAIPKKSDIDFLSIGIPDDVVKRLSLLLSDRFQSLCRGVEFAAASYDDFSGNTDEAYGGRVFLRHYNVHLHGHDIACLYKPFLGDAKAARGFNGDIENYYQRWCLEIADANPDQLGRRIARKSLLAVAALVSIHDHIWTTDRNSSALRWGQLNPYWLSPLNKLVAWSEGVEMASAPEVNQILSGDGLINAIVKDFRKHIGLWLKPGTDKTDMSYEIVAPY